MARVKSHSGPYIFGGSALRIELQTGQAPVRKGREEGAVTPGSKGDKRDATKSAAHHAGAAAQPFRVASYFGAFDPVHENHIRQALAACQEFRIDACFLCPNSDQGNTRKSIGVSQSERVEMLQRRCDGHGVLRAFNCGGRAWDWAGRCAVVFLRRLVYPPQSQQECCHAGGRKLAAACGSWPPHATLPNYRPGLVRPFSFPLLLPKPFFPFCCHVSIPQDVALQVREGGQGQRQEPPRS
jgi:hypothetical protein